MFTCLRCKIEQHDDELYYSFNNNDPMWQAGRDRAISYFDTDNPIEMEAVELMKKFSDRIPPYNICDDCASDLVGDWTWKYWIKELRKSSGT